MTDIQTLYQKAIRFAAEKHGDQKVKGSEISYVVHLSNVAMEIFMAERHTADFDLSYALQVALLHDVIEDPKVSYEELKLTFGADIADAVEALSKNDALEREMKMPDCLERIRKHRKEVLAVKLADRITNLQSPPSEWFNDKIKSYLEESRLIYDALREGNHYLADRLRTKIEEYQQFIR